MSVSEEETYRGWRIVVFDETTSTQDEARRLAAERIAAGRPPGGVVAVARTQTKGRGRLGRPWLSPPGGFYGTFVFRPAPALATLRAGLAAAEALGRFEVVTKIKWPNDLVVETGGGVKKIGGILAEMVEVGGVREVLLLGFGVNLAGPPAGGPGAGAGAAGGAADLRGVPIPPDDYLRALIDEISIPLRSDAVVARVNERLYGLGRRARLPGGVSGIVDGVALDGALILHPDGRAGSASGTAAGASGAYDPTDEIRVSEGEVAFV